MINTLSLPVSSTTHMLKNDVRSFGKNKTIYGVAGSMVIEISNRGSVMLVENSKHKFPASSKDLLRVSLTPYIHKIPNLKGFKKTTI